MPLVYGELRRLARSYMRRERPGHPLRTTGLVHEAYLRLVGKNANWTDRAHFLGIAAKIHGQRNAGYPRDTKRFAVVEGFQN
jgi:hypothetical protein